MKGIGGLAVLSMSNASVAEAQEVLNSPLSSDPHTRDTYRSIVAAIIPRTPELESELGSEHVPGGLDVELEKYLIWDFNHFQEIRVEMVSEKAGSGPEMPVSLLETALDTTGPGSPLDALMDLTGVGDLLGLDFDRHALDEHLSFGKFERLDTSFTNLDSASDGPAVFDLLVETANESIHQVLQNYPYAPAFALVFDVVAAEFIARGENEDAISRDRSQFPAGGTFVQLSPQDRLRCLWTIVEGGAIDRLDALLSPLLPQVGILKYVVMAINGLHGFGYYTEWSGLGSTKTATPTDREMQTSPDEVQSRTQTGYPGPTPGNSANWRHAVPGGFDDPDVTELHLPDDLTGEDVIDGIGGET